MASLFLCGESVWEEYIFRDWGKGGEARGLEQRLGEGPGRMKKGCSGHRSPQGGFSLGTEAPQPQENRKQTFPPVFEPKGEGVHT